MANAVCNVRCISKVVDAYKINNKTKHTFKLLGAIAFDDRILSYNLEGATVSIFGSGTSQVSVFAGVGSLTVVRYNTSASVVLIGYRCRFRERKEVSQTQYYYSVLFI